MIEIRVLAQLDVRRFYAIRSGYTSLTRYVVSKVETPGRTAITLELVPFELPYVKEWDRDEEMEAQYQDALKHGLSLGAYAGDRLVGIALAEPHTWNRSLWVWEFHVEQVYRGQGIGQRLMEALAQKAREAGLRAIVCETQNTNVPAIAFYRRAGFEIEGVDLSYYTNHDVTDGEVAIFMKRKLD